MKDWRVCRPPKRPVDSSLYKELSALYCVAGVVHRAGLRSDGMFLSSLPLESGKVEPLDAILGPPWDRWIAHTVEFSKTACAPGAGTPLLRRTGRLLRRRIRAGPTSIAPAASPGNFCLALQGTPSDRAAQCSAGPDGRLFCGAGLTPFRHPGGIA